MQIREIKTAEEILETYDVLKQIYESLEKDSYTKNILEMLKNGYQMAAVFEDLNIENGRCIGVVGIRTKNTIHYGKILEIEDFMIDRKKRGIGVGKILLRWVDWQALQHDCKNVIGLLETKRQESQKIFAREGFLLDGFLFKKTY